MILEIAVVVVLVLFGVIFLALAPANEPKSPRANYDPLQDWDLDQDPRFDPIGVRHTPIAPIGEVIPTAPENISSVQKQLMRAYQCDATASHYQVRRHKEQIRAVDEALRHGREYRNIRLRDREEHHG